MRRYFGGEHLLRAGRISEAGNVYLVTTNACRRRPVFRSLRNGRIVVNALRFADDQRWSRTLAYVVMPDHLHWLFRLGPSRGLSEVVASVKGFSSRQIRSVAKVRTEVWQEGFHDRAVRTGEDLRSLARYVVANPLRARLVEDLARYPLWDAVWLESGGDGTDILS